MAVVYSLAIIALFLSPLAGSATLWLWPHTLSTYGLAGLLLVGWPIWRELAPRPIQGLRALAGVAGPFGACVAVACMTGDLAVESYGVAIQAFGMVALALWAEIARAALEGRAREEALPEMRARVRGS